MHILIVDWRDPADLGAAEDTELQEKLRSWAGAHQVTVLAQRCPSKPNDEVLGGYRVLRTGDREGLYADARRWWRDHGRGRYDMVLSVGIPGAPETSPERDVDPQWRRGAGTAAAHAYVPGGYLVAAPA